MEVWGDTKQYTIFDYMSAGEVPEYKSIEEITEEEVADILFDNFGVKFSQNETLGGRWYYKKGRHKLSFYIGTYREGAYRGGQKFVSASYDTSTYGSSRPSDTIEEFLMHMKRFVGYLQEGTQRNK